MESCFPALRNRNPVQIPSQTVPRLVMKWRREGGDGCGIGLCSLSLVITESILIHFMPVSAFVLACNLFALYRHISHSSWRGRCGIWEAGQNIVSNTKLKNKLTFF